MDLVLILGQYPSAGMAFPFDMNTFTLSRASCCDPTSEPSSVFGLCLRDHMCACRHNARKTVVYTWPLVMNEVIVCMPPWMQPWGLSGCDPDGVRHRRLTFCGWTKVQPIRATPLRSLHLLHLCVWLFTFCNTPVSGSYRFANRLTYIHTSNWTHWVVWMTSLICGFVSTSFNPFYPLTFFFPYPRGLSAWWVFPMYWRQSIFPITHTRNVWL